MEESGGWFENHCWGAPVPGRRACGFCTLHLFPQRELAEPARIYSIYGCILQGWPWYAAHAFSSPLEYGDPDLYAGVVLFDPLFLPAQRMGREHGTTNSGRWAGVLCAHSGPLSPGGGAIQLLPGAQP